MFAGRRVDRTTRGLLLSAARSHLFNVVLAERVPQQAWDSPLDGELWCLDGSRSLFGPQAFDAALAARLAAFDIHPSGPLWGRGDTPAAGACGALERDVAARMLDLVAGLEAAGLEHERRPLRLRLGEPRWTWQDAETLQLAFALPAGAYATSVVRELART